VPKARKQTPPPQQPRWDLWICAAILLATLVLYAQVRDSGFVNYDDPDYVTNNRHVRAGLSVEGAAWAFTSREAANWFPLTRLSHMLDVQLFGLDAGWHHFFTVLLHAAASVLLFLFLNRATRARWPSAFVAFLFALHPLHVESVAWISERKDVLCALFWFLALWAYVANRRLLVIAAFCLGLMSKPMIVTLPFTLMLLDVWPLGRAVRVWDKAPLFVITAAGAVATYAVQHASGAVKAIGALGIGNALVSYVVYLVKFFFPSGLAAFYPYPADLPVWEPALAEHGTLLIEARAKWVSDSAAEFSRLSEMIGERGEARMRYVSPFAESEARHDVLLAAFEEKRGLDIKRGLTHVGPHRDDLELTLDGRELRLFGSAGQQRTAAIALRMLEAATLRAHAGADPILLLDDPFAELDTRRNTRILELLQKGGLGQAILAVPRESDIPAELMRLDRLSIRDGVFDR